MKKSVGCGTIVTRGMLLSPKPQKRHSFCRPGVRVLKAENVQEGLESLSSELEKIGCKTINSGIVSGGSPLLKYSDGNDRLLRHGPQPVRGAKSD